MNTIAHFHYARQKQGEMSLNDNSKVWSLKGEFVHQKGD